MSRPPGGSASRSGANMYSSMFLASEEREPKFSGAAVRIAFTEPFYVGIGVCSHNKDVTEKAVFSNVELTALDAAAAGRPVLYSTLETQAIASTDRRVVHVTPSRIEAPNWLRDGKSLDLQQPAAGSSGYPRRAGSRKPSTPASPPAATTTTGSRPTARMLAISDQSRGNGRVAHLHAADHRRHAHARSRPPAPRTGTAGRPTARRWPSAASAMASSTSTRSPPRAAPRRG